MFHAELLIMARAAVMHRIPTRTAGEQHEQIRHHECKHTRYSVCKKHGIHYRIINGQRKALWPTPTHLFEA